MNLILLLNGETIDDEYNLYMHHNTNNEQIIYLVEFRSNRMTVTKNTKPLYGENDVFDSKYKFSNSGQNLILYSITLDKLWENKYDSITLLKEN